MTGDLRLSIVLDCVDADRLARFWAEALGYDEVGRDGQYIGLRRPDGKPPTFVLQQVAEPKVGKNRMHVDLHIQDLDVEVARLTELGATVLVPEEIEPDGMHIVVMADPEGNEFCVLSPADT